MAALAGLGAALGGAFSGASSFLTLASTGLSLVGTLAAAGGQADAGAAERNAAYFRAQQEERNAQEERAASQRRAISKRNQVGSAQSTLLARAAASGGGADDPTIISLATGIEGEGEYQALSEMYLGENRARGLEDQAMASRMTGDAAYRAGQTRSTATLIGGATSLLDKFSRVKFG